MSVLHRTAAAVSVIWAIEQLTLRILQITCICLVAATPSHHRLIKEGDSHGLTRQARACRPAAAIVAATLTTAYIHFTLGGLLFLLNAVGYATLAALVVAPLAFMRRLRDLDPNMTGTLVAE